MPISIVLQKTANGNVKGALSYRKRCLMGLRLGTFCSDGYNRLTVSDLYARKRKGLFAGIFLCYGVGV